MGYNVRLDRIDKSVNYAKSELRPLIPGVGSSRLPSSYVINWLWADLNWVDPTEVDLVRLKSPHLKRVATGSSVYALAEHLQEGIFPEDVIPAHDYRTPFLPKILTVSPPDFLMDVGGTKGRRLYLVPDTKVDDFSDFLTDEVGNYVDAAVLYMYARVTKSPDWFHTSRGDPVKKRARWYGMNKPPLDKAVAELYPLTLSQYLTQLRQERFLMRRKDDQLVLPVVTSNKPSLEEVCVLSTSFGRFSVGPASANTYRNAYDFDPRKDAESREHLEADLVVALKHYESKFGFIPSEGEYVATGTDFVFTMRDQTVFRIRLLRTSVFDEVSSSPDHAEEVDTIPDLDELEFPEDFDPDNDDW
jgi:hypothetical protein